MHEALFFFPERDEILAESIRRSINARDTCNVQRTAVIIAG